MSKFVIVPVLLAAALSTAPQTAESAGPANEQVLQQQRAALQKLERYDGVWRGEATVLNADGSTLRLIQTERVGPMLGGSIRLIEGRGYLQDGTIVFNAFAVVSYSPSSGRYNFRSYAQGYAGDFPMELTEDGFRWSIKAGPATIRYTSTVRNDEWIEVGERIEPDRPTIKTFEMRLRRIGTTGWPEAGTPGPR